jgi:hypothetical protein
MLTVVLVVAVIGIAMLAVAILTGSTVVALIVIALAALGLLLLARDWLKERRGLDATGKDDREETDDASNGRATAPEHVEAERPLEPDKFEPDVLYEESDALPDDADEKARESEYHGAGSDNGAQ